MAIETELKLRLSPEQLAKLKGHGLIKLHQIQRTVTRRLYNVYFDTPKHELHKSQMALRLRRIGRKWMQTLKGGGSMEAGLHQRNEWEVPVSGAKLDFSMPLSHEWRQYLPKSLRKKLRPIFVTDFSRSSRVLLWQGAEIELCMDQGVVNTERQSIPICELELELKSGTPRALFELASEILDIVPCELETVSKAEQGYRLIADFVESPVKAMVPNYPRKATLPEILQMLIWSCLSQFQCNLSGALSSDNMEYLHQMRIALRRLRVLLHMAEQCHADVELTGLKRDIATLNGFFGRIREWDVFINQTLKPLTLRIAEHDGLQALLESSEKQREACYIQLRDVKNERELQCLILRMAIWMYGSFWQQQDFSPARQFVAKRLRKLSKRFKKSTGQLDSLDAPKLHRLRIATKQLRYITEFFPRFYDGKDVDSFLAVLCELQEILGDINDIAIAHRLLDELDVQADLSPYHEAIVLAKGWIAHELTGHFSALKKKIFRHQGLKSL